MADTFELSAASKRRFEEATGLGFAAAMDMDWDDIDAAIAKKAGKAKLGYMSAEDPRLVGRGQVYHVLGRYVDMDEIDRRLTEIAALAEA